MNAGAKITRAALLCFHHADSELGSEHIVSLVNAARTQRNYWGSISSAFRRPACLDEVVGELAPAHQQSCRATFRRSVALCESRCFSPAGRLRGHPAHGGYRILQASPPSWSHHITRPAALVVAKAVPAPGQRADLAYQYELDCSFLSRRKSPNAPSMVLRRRNDRARLCKSAARELSSV